VNTSVEFSLADSFRVVDLERLLFGVEAAGKPHLLSLLAARSARLSGLKPHRIFEAMSTGVHFTSDRIAGGVAVVSAALPEFGGVVWTAARLVTPADCEARDGLPVDLAFAVVGNPRSVTARRAAQSFARLSRDPEALAYLRAATSVSWFRAELTWALERLDYREPAKMTG
jgi:mannitol/fructose-specific phosphotransferase system IIA component (Ntr-type)